VLRAAYGLATAHALLCIVNWDKSAVFRYFVRADKQTHWQTNKQTDNAENIHLASLRYAGGWKAFNLQLWVFFAWRLLVLIARKLADVLETAPVNCSSGAFCTSSTTRSTTWRCSCSTRRGYVSRHRQTGRHVNAGANVDCKFIRRNNRLLRKAECAVHSSEPRKEKFPDYAENRQRNVSDLDDCLVMSFRPSDQP